MRYLGASALSHRVGEMAGQECQDAKGNWGTMKNGACETMATDAAAEQRSQNAEGAVQIGSVVALGVAGYWIGSTFFPLIGGVVGAGVAIGLGWPLLMGAIYDEPAGGRS